MVMEAPPSPQCVGREFVRQYYTLLNQAPSHLHRFYNNNSSFVHGGLDAPNRESNPVVGQKQIHQKIQQLNFRDCHAKISQVDSQATLGNGIVVQVTGELSNSGQPMRRFTQTFVLAAQSPKKYYVHNDIFRYQDMLGDDELEHDSVRSDGDDEVHDQLEPTHSDSCPPQSQPLPQQMGYYNNTSPLANQTNIAPAQAVTPVPPPTVQPTTNVVLQAPPQLPLINGSAHTDEVLQTQIVAPQLPTAAPATPIVPSVAPPHLISQQVVPGANAAIQTQQPASPTTQPGAPALAPVVPPPQQQPQVPLQPPTTLNTTQQIPPQVPAPTVPQQPSETIPVEPEPVTPEQEEIEIADEEIVESPIKQEEDLQPEPVTANEPKTYATSVKSGASASAIHTTTSKPATTSPPPTMRPVEQRETTSSTTAANISGGFGMGQGGRGAGGPRRGAANIRGMTRTDRSGPTTRAPYVNEENGLGSSNAVDGDRRRPSSSQYPDNFQLFLGNIPSYVTEDDLKKFFTKYGTVIDVRIHGKPTNKNISGGRVPNYGFIFFDSAESAANVLKEKPIFLPGQNGDHKLNVEEKKTRSRPAMDGSRISEGGNSLAGGRNGGGNINGNGVGPGNGNGNGGNRGGNNGQSGGGSGGNGGGNMMMRGGGSGGGMPRGGARGGFGGNRGEGRGGGNMSRGTGYRRN